MTTVTEEKVELTEQTPLTTEGGEGQTEAGQQAAPEKKKWWFRKGKKPEAAEGEKAAAEKTEGGGGADENAEPKEKKPCWWQRKPKCKATCGEGTSFGIDYVRRDEQQLQTAIDLNFGDIFGEPDAVHSLNGVWRVTHSIFTAVRNFFYKVFTIILCVPAAFIFGVLFALISALGVFVIIPAGRLLAVPAGWFFKLWAYFVTNVFEPLGSGIAHIFSRIKIYRYGINNDPTATIGA